MSDSIKVLMRENKIAALIEETLHRPNEVQRLKVTCTNCGYYHSAKASPMPPRVKCPFCRSLLRREYE